MTGDTGKDASAGQPAPPSAIVLSAPSPATTATPRADDAQRGPVIVLSYLYAGAEQVQREIAAGMTCTARTGILPQCRQAMATWQRLEARPGRPSNFAAATVRNLITAQVTMIMARSGGSRWCEVATSRPDAAVSFMAVFPQTKFVCVHRSCAGVAREAMRAALIGDVGTGLGEDTLDDPGKGLAALTAYWTERAQQLLTFEAENPDVTIRLRYEDIKAGNGAADEVRHFLGLPTASPPVVPAGALAEPPASVSPGDAGPALLEGLIPANVIPESVRRDCAEVHRKLGYEPPWSG
jgi:hypothetical protein